MHPTVTLPGGTTLFTFPLLLTLGATFFCAYILTAAGDDVPVAKTIGFLAVTLVTGASGARVCYFLFYDPNALLANPLVIFGDQGGLCFLGSLVTMLVSGPVYLRLAGIPVMPFLAMAAPAAAFAHGIGRIGCLLGGCCYGTATHLPWAFAQPELSGDHAARHPTQLYEMIVLFALGWVLHRLSKRGASAESICRLYVGVLALERFLMELLRGDTQGESVLLGLTFAQAICATLALLCAAWTALKAGRETSNRQTEGKLPGAAGTLRPERKGQSRRCARVRISA